MKNSIQSITYLPCTKRPITPPRQKALLAVATIFALFTSIARAGDVCEDGCFYSNTYQGDNALLNFGSGGQETAFGSYALSDNTSGTDNTAIGAYAMVTNTTGAFNTAIGSNALHNNTIDVDGYSADENTAAGAYALYSNTTGSYNTATGGFALYSTTTGRSNTATGYSALYFNTTAYSNTAIGSATLYYNTTGGANTAVGDTALYNSNGSSNTAVGNCALVNNTSGGSNIAIGDHAGSVLTTGSNNIDIGHKGVAAESNTIRIGTSQKKTFVAGISGKTVANGAGVIINSNGQLGTIQSSARYKTAIKPMGKASESILSLQPVSFHYRKDLDPESVPQFGLVAEQVEKINPDLVIRGDDGKPYTVRYEAVNAMLLNEFLKAHRKLEEQEKEIAALRSQVQRVSDQLSLGKATPRVVLNNP